MTIVGFLVEGYQDVDVISRRQDRVDRDAGLRPSGATQNLGREGGERKGVIAHLGGGLGQAFGGSHDTLSAFASEPNDEITHLHMGRPPSSQ
ncbi:hypothetical protein GBAR_LOCUS4339 [Geodia barretti]|uniref:Uncharacterized protein n=1 Tax=Geodia barretti TaxID=519541 RepID=A0AA35W2G2_GEOBA|nr:hypothetical protein GBAR_LOCUS4339 [Geodia barretti]